MDLLWLFQWFEATRLGSVVRESIWMFPVIECFHLLSLALLGGTVLAVDLRALGFGLRSQGLADLADKLHPWMAGALAAIIATGVPMFLSEAVKCYYSPPFWYKMGLLLVATAFTFTIRRRTFRSGTPRAGMVALVSLALWFGVGFSGRWIAFY
jgi:hypothetical protein